MGVGEGSIGAGAAFGQRQPGLMEFAAKRPLKYKDRKPFGSSLELFHQVLNARLAAKCADDAGDLGARCFRLISGREPGRFLRLQLIAKQ